MSNEISLVMGSSSDWSTMKEAANILDEFGVKYDKAVISAHRMPQEMFEFAQGAVSAGIKVIIAGAGGAAHLPGMIAANTVLPVIGVPLPFISYGGTSLLVNLGVVAVSLPILSRVVKEAQTEKENDGELPPPSSPLRRKRSFLRAVR